MNTVKFADNNMFYDPAIATVSFDNDHVVGLMFELLDTRDFYDKPDNDYPYIVSASLMLDAPNAAFSEQDAAETTAESLLEDTYRYCGGVPIDHVLQDELSSPGEPPLFSLFTIDEAKKVTVKYDFGTIAAQRGKGTSYTYLQFTTIAAAEKYANVLLSRASSLTTTDLWRASIGFVLDRPINMAGDNGWSVLQAQVNGPTVYTKKEVTK